MTKKIPELLQLVFHAKDINIIDNNNFRYKA